MCTAAEDTQADGTRQQRQQVLSRVQAQPNTDSTRRVDYDVELFSFSDEVLAQHNLEAQTGAAKWFDRKFSRHKSRSSARIAPMAQFVTIDLDLNDVGVPGTAIVSPVAYAGSRAIAAPICGYDVEAPSATSRIKVDALPGHVDEASSFVGRLLVMYSDSLDKRPVITKSVSSGVIGLFGDLTAQCIEWGFASAPVPWSNSHALWRSCAVMFDGFFVNGPLLHYAYEALERCMPAEESLISAMMQVGVDVFIIDPLFALIFIWSTGLIEGRSIQNEILHTLEYDYVKMVLWLIVIGLCWAPLQIYLFNRYPVQYRVLTADLIDLVWTCVTSFFAHA